MNLSRFLILGAAVGALAACSGDNTSPKLVTPGPAALMHVVNAVPDTGALDFRFTDTIDGVPNVEFVNLPFRGGTDVGYQRVSPGSHHIRVFMSSSNPNAAGIQNDPAIVSTVMGDTTFTFVDGVHYTFVFYGSARAAAQKFKIFTDDFTVPAGISVRVMNFNTAAADFYLNSTASALTAVPSTSTVSWLNVAPVAASAYTAAAVAVSPNTYALTAAAAGTAAGGTTVWSTLMNAGSPGVPEVQFVSGALQALPGARIAGSIFTGILFPRSTAGSKAASYTTPGILLMPDRFCTNIAATSTC